MHTLTQPHSVSARGMRALLATCLFVLAACLPVCCVAEDAANDATAAPLPLLPLPANLARSPGYFTLRRGAKLILRSDNAEALGVAKYFVGLADSSYGAHLDLQPHTRAGATDDAIVFVLDPNFLVSGDAGGEGYELSVSARGIRLVARTPQGLFRGSVTLWQLLGTEGAAAPLRVPNVAIADHARFAWRGLMLDSSRHMQTPDEIKRLLEQMALHKLNVLHWHLTDDQGWRIQINKYPKLTEVGAWRKRASIGGDAPRYGGFYTQQQIRDIVAYAALRYITIVPEIEMPGHAQAAIAAYPQLGTDPDKAPPVSPDWGVHTYLYNVDDATFTFIEDVLGEVMQLFPGSYIHVGGDEAAKDQWQASARVQQRMRELDIKGEAVLQGWFTARIEKFLSAHGRRLIGWDEILEGSVPPSATVMSWHGSKGAVEAARGGHDVVLAPSPVLYFDHVQSKRHDEPPGRPDVVSLADVYAFEAAPAELDAAQARHVLGAQGNLWSEYLDTDARLEHAAFPRSAALAEALWTPAARRQWADFRQRMPAQMARYRAFGIAAAQSEFSAAPVAEAGRRSSDELLPCNPGKGLALRLPGPARNGKDGVYNVDIFDPCWIYPDVDLDATQALAIDAAQLPYNFQLWKDAKNVVARAPAGQLQAHLDRCDGKVVASLQWRGDAQHIASIELPLRDRHGVHDVCLISTRGVADPIWAIDSVRLRQR